MANDSTFNPYANDYPESTANPNDVAGDYRPNDVAGITYDINTDIDASRRSVELGDLGVARDPGPRAVHMPDVGPRSGQAGL